ncbi:MAG TPA: tRNA (adenosine(37)-N6)-dimethylallyltransferase MiaA [Gemmatimonadaceae bacterium]|nr:tRNA (adenosine(37)-N6)-dimethylallyltransferase MiaA [Gemmatimonadaceae bacterium]
MIVGPTAAGKSMRAMEAAARGDIAIISADSRQIYRKFDIGTAKPTPEELSSVVHFGVNVVEPTEHYSAYQWARDAARWIGEAERLGKVPIIVGGTGFYVKSLFDPPYDEPPVADLDLVPEYEVVDPGPDLRNHIETRVDQMLENGWLDEVASLMHSVPADAIAWKASGYRVMRRHLEGEYSLADARERAIIETRQYAKRQRTWFRHQLP